MKKIFTKLNIMICAVLLTFQVNAQIPYTFNQGTATYTPVTGGTNLYNFTWDDEDAFVPLGFNFTYLGKTYNEVVINSNGILIFDLDSQGVPLATSLPVITVFGDYWFGGLGADLIDRGTDIGTPQSPVVYKTEGVAPNRVFLVEWQNAGFFEDDPLYTSYINVQLKIHETTNNIQVIMGPNSVNPGLYEAGSTGPVIGLGTWDASSISFISGLYLSGPPSAAVAVNSYTSLSGTPVDGTVYNFIAGGTSVNDISGLDVQIYPNPVTDFIKINLSDNRIFNLAKVTDVQGKEMIVNNISHSNDITLDVSGLACGVYILVLQSEATTHTIKFVK